MCGIIFLSNAMDAPAFIASYGLVLLKDFVFSGTYKALWSKNLVFAPYARILCSSSALYSAVCSLALAQTSIVLIFVVVKLWFSENLLDYNKMIKAPATTALQNKLIGNPLLIFVASPVVSLTCTSVILFGKRRPSLHKLLPGIVQGWR